MKIIKLKETSRNLKLVFLFVFKSLKEIARINNCIYCKWNAYLL